MRSSVRARTPPRRAAVSGPAPYIGNRLPLRRTALIGKWPPASAFLLLVLRLALRHTQSCEPRQTAVAVPPVRGRRCLRRAVQSDSVQRRHGCRGHHVRPQHGRAGKKYLPETVGSGCAFFDADGDGWPDILLINSKDWQPKGTALAPRPLPQQQERYLHRRHRGQRARCRDVRHRRRPSATSTTMAMTTSTSRRSKGDRLFHNDGHFKFRDVTKASGIANACVRHERRLAGLRQGRAARPLRRQLREVVRRNRPVLFDGRHEQDRTARPRRTREPPRSCITTSATGSSRT